MLWRVTDVSNHIFDDARGEEEEAHHCITDVDGIFTPFLDAMMSWPHSTHSTLFTLMLSKMSCTDANDDGSLMSGHVQPMMAMLMPKADGPNNNGKMMPCPVAHVMLAKMKMPTND